MKMKNKFKRILSGIMAAGMTLSLIPSITTYAAQSNEYVDPADVWIEANGRTNVKGLYSEKKDKTYDAAVVLIDSTDKYVHYRLDFDGADRN